MVRRVQKVLNGADDPSFIARCTSFDHRVQVVLRAQDFSDAGVYGEQSDTAQPPFGWPVFLEQIVIVDSLMGAMKSADSDVGDSLTTLAPVIDRNANARR